MGRKAQIISQEELDNVYKAIEELIFRSHKLCSVDEVIKETKLSENRCRKILRILTSSGKITIVYEGKGKPTIYIPTYMFKEILRAQYKPPWIEKYTFSEKAERLKQIKKTREEIFHYETIERLLYGTNIPLEEAVAYCLKYLEFEDVQHHKEKDSHDVSFLYDGKKYLLEIQGTTKQGNKDKIGQLRGWIEKEVDKGINPDKIVGIFVVNHFRDKDPKERGEPLTKHAISYLKLYHFKFFTTWFLFNIIKGVIKGEISKEKARKLVVEGETYV